MLEDMTLGDKIALLRKIKQIKQKDIAVALNFSDKTISSWENNLSEPGLSEIKQLAKYFNVSINFLMEGIVNNEQDKKILNEYKRQQELDKVKNELCMLIEQFEKADENFINEAFVISPDTVLCNLETVVAHGNLKLFQALNSRYDFYEESGEESETEEVRDLWGKVENGKKRKIRKHPIELNFEDITITDNIEFYQYVLQKIDEKIAAREENNRRLKGMGYSHGQMLGIDREKILCDALDDITVDLENEKRNDIILFLIEKGAYVRKYIPYKACEGYQVFEDKFMTDFIKSTILTLRKLKK